MLGRLSRKAALVVLIRAATYAALFIGFFLVFLPARLLSWSGVVQPADVGLRQIIGMVGAAAGLALALWCV